MISHQLRPSNQPITKNHHLQTQFEGLTIKSDPQVGRQTLNKFDYPILSASPQFILSYFLFYGLTIDVPQL